MEHAVTDSNPLKLDAVVSRQVMVARLLTGLLQGALLYPLYRAVSNSFWPATQPYLFAPLLLLCLLLPVLLISSLGHMRTPWRAWARGAGGVEGGNVARGNLKGNGFWVAPCSRGIDRSGSAGSA